MFIHKLVKLVLGAAVILSYLFAQAASGAKQNSCRLLDGDD